MGYFRAIPANSTTCGKSSPASWTQANSKNTARSTAKLFFADTPASAAGPSGLWRIKKSTCRRWRAARTRNASNLVRAARQRLHVQTLARGSDQKRIEFGGVIYTESAEKAARFILDCNQNRIPLVFIHDVNGFMVGKDAEWSGIIRAGAKMVNAV